MEFHPDLAPEMRNQSPEKNHDFLAQAMLMGRNPGGEEDWVARYAARFRELYTKDDHFRDLVNEELTDDVLNEIQVRLDERIERAA